MACDEDPAGGADSGVLDAATPDAAAPDATTPDAAPVDAAPVDAAPVDAEPQPDAAITVSETVSVVSNGGLPLASIDVFTNDASGVLLATYTTDASGQVQVDVPVGGSVTVVRHTPPTPPTTTDSYELHTALELAQGGHFQASVYSPLDEPVRDDMHITATVASSPVGTDSYRMFVGNCSTGSMDTTIDTDVHEYCGYDTTYDLIIYARDAADNKIGFATVLDATYLGNQTVLHTIDATHVTFVDLVLDATNIPSDATSAQVHAAGTRAGRSTRMTWDFDSVNAPQTSEQHIVRMPQGPLSSYLLQYSVGLPDVGNMSRSRFYELSDLASWPTAHEVDMGQVADVAVVNLPDFTTVTRPVLGWTLDTGPVGQVVESFGSFRKTGSSAGWAFYGSAQATGLVQLPELPSFLPDCVPQAGDTWFVVATRHYVLDAGYSLADFYAGTPGPVIRSTTSQIIYNTPIP